MSDKLDISQQFYNHLRAFIRTKIENPEDASDILQDSLYKAQLNIHLLKEDSKFNSWLYQIIRNSIIDFYRKKSVTIDSDNINIADEYWTLDDNDNEQISKCLKSLIQELPKEYREPLQLYELNEMSQEEISVHISLSVSGTKSRIQRARKKLRDIILQCCKVNTDKYGNVVANKRTSQITNCC